MSARVLLQSTGSPLEQMERIPVDKLLDMVSCMSLPLRCDQMHIQTIVHMLLAYSMFYDRA
jgi:hypothetical protein